ncbi:MAG: PAS domain-containing protein [Rhodocyclaceae bacterium]|nr:PAS domain-containing protein [Rhodocyclaceae bacterium]
MRRSPFASKQAVFITNARGVILRVNQAFEEITRYGAPEIVGKTPKVLQSGRHDAAFDDPQPVLLRSLDGMPNLQNLQMRP